MTVCPECRAKSDGDYCPECGSYLHPDHIRERQDNRFKEWAGELDEGLKVNPALGLSRSVGFDVSRKDVAWEYPLCGYLITDCEMTSARYDYGCFRCQCSFTQFRQKHLPSSVDLPVGGEQ